MEVEPVRDDRLTRNTLGLMASSAITSLVGVAFWLVASRTFTETEVSHGVALITSFVLLSNISTLGFRNTLARFIPAAGAAAPRFVITVYLLCAAAATVSATVFLVGLPWWARELDFVRASTVSIMFFIVGTAVWTVFVLQDSVLTGLRNAAWVPVENGLYSAGKLLGLVAFAALGIGTWSFGLAWVIPAAITIVPISWLIRRRMIDEPMLKRPPEPTYRRGSVARFAIGEQVSDVLRTTGSELVVLIVLARRGVEESGSFFLAVTITTTLAVFAANIAGAFMVEAAARPDEEALLLRRSALHAARLVVPAALITCLVAPNVMAVFGDTYREDAGSLLRVLALGAIPQALIALGVGVARLHRRMVLVSVLFGASALGPLVGALLLNADRGLMTVGVAAVIGQTIVATALLLTLLRPLVRIRVDRGVAARLVRARDVVRQNRRSRELATLLDELDSGRGQDDRLIPRRILRSDNDVAIVAVDQPGRPMILKLALSEAAASGLDRHADALEALHSLAHQPVLDLVPDLIERGICHDHVYTIERACQGHVPLVADHDTVRITAESIRAVHDLTVRRQRVDDALLAALVDGPIDQLLAVERLAVHRHALLDLRSRLRHELVGRMVHTARTHGDCWIGNFLVSGGAGGQRVEGIIDWEDGLARGMPDIDVAHHWLSTQDDDLPTALRRAVQSDDPDALLADDGLQLYDPHIAPSAVLLLAWLAHVTNGLRRATRFGLSSWWIGRNVVAVLRFTATLPDLEGPRADSAPAGRR